MSVRSLAQSLEITAAIADPYGPGGPANHQYWAAPIDLGTPGGDQPRLYALGVGRHVNASWWVPITNFAAIANFLIIFVDVREDDIYLGLLGVSRPAGQATLNISVTYDKSLL
jgi:hypothetical protein